MESTPSITEITETPAMACTKCTTTPAVMTVSEAARLIRSSKAYLYVGIREGRFPSVRTGRKRGLPMAFMRGFIENVIDRGIPISFEEYAASWIENAQAVA